MLRHKLFTVFLIVSMLTMSLSFLTFQNNMTVEATVSVVDSSITKNYSIRLPKQHKIFQAVTRYWYWYCTGSQIGFKTSLDGNSWSSFTSIGSESAAAYFDVYFSGTKVYYVRAQSVGTNLYFRSGTPNSDGTITWDASEQFVLTDANTPGDPSIIVDSNGYPWIAYGYSIQPKAPSIVKSDYNNGTWLTSSGYPYALTTKTYYLPVVFPLLDGKIYAIYAMAHMSGTPNYVYGRLFNGTGWESETQISTSKVANDYWQEWDALSDVYGNGHVAFINLTAHNILYIQRNNITGIWGSEEQVYANVGNSRAMSISYFYNDVYCFWNGYPTASHYYYSKRQSGVWGSTVDWIDDTSDGQPNKNNLVTSGKTYNGEILVGWLAKSSSPYSAKFERLTMGDIESPTYSNVGTNTTIVDQPCKFYAKWTDDVGLSGYIFSSNITTQTQHLTSQSLSYDGYIKAGPSWDYTSTQTASSGTTYAGENEIAIGQWKDAGLYTIFRGYLYFDTSILTSKMQITSIVLSIYVYEDYSTTDFNLTLQSCAWNTYPHIPLEDGDYIYAAYSGNGGSRNTNTIGEIGYWNITLTAQGLSWINQDGITKLCLRSSKDINGDSPSYSEYIKIYANEKGSAYAPKLYVTYQDWINETWTGLSGNPAWANVTKTLPSEIGRKVGYQWACNDTSNNWAVTPTYSLTTTAGNVPTYSNIAYNTTLVNTPCEFSVYLEDDVALSGYIFQTNNTGSWVNETWVDLGGVQSAWANVTKTLNSTIGLEVRFKWYINDTFGNSVTTTIGFLVLTTTGSGYPYYSNVGYNTTLINMPCKFSIKWMDDVGLSGFIFSWSPTGEAWTDDAWQTLTGTSDWANVTKTLPSVEGTAVYIRWYCNDTDDQWTNTPIFALITKQYYYYFNWNYKDLETNIVDSQVTWALYKSGTLVNYVKGQGTLRVGTYVLKAYYRTIQINETTLTTETYGNTSFSLTLQMKPYDIIAQRYIAFNKAITTITINSVGPTILTFTANGSLSNYIIVISVSQNATYITKDGVVQTGWIYNSANKYIKIETASLNLNTWTIIFPYYVPPFGQIFWYMRSDSHTINTVTGYKLYEQNTGSQDGVSASISGDYAVYYGFRVWLIEQSGTSAELTSGQIYSYRNLDAEGIQNIAWNAPERFLNIGFDAVKIVAYIKFGEGDWQIKATFISDELIKKNIVAKQWVFQVYTKRVVSWGITSASIYWGNSNYESGISGIELTEPSTQEMMLYLLQKGNFVGAITFPYLSLIGNLFYGIIMLIICVPIYNRYRSFVPILILFIIFGGAGGIFGLLVPAVGMQIAWVFLLFGLAGLLWKVFR